jgi:uncharacterized phage protein (TIGR01671 family)
MREILFRGKRKDNREWFRGNLLRLNKLAFIVPKNTWFKYGELSAVIEVYPETIGQYTGMKDKNGTKIFEGDIVHGLMDYGPAGLYERNNIVINFNETVGGYEWQYFNLDTIEVIGNIYDNPELLEEHE